MGTTKAVVLSGGGADGAYGVGVLKALFNGESPSTGRKRLDPEIISGTSVGSYNAAGLLSNWREGPIGSIAHLEKVWVEVLAEGSGKCGNGVYRFRANPLQVLQPSCLSDPGRLASTMLADSTFLGQQGLSRAFHLFTAFQEPWLQRVTETLDLSLLVSRQPFEESIRRTIRFDQIRESDKILKLAATNWSEGTVEIFTKIDMTDQSGVDILLSSSAIPGFFEPVVIGSKLYVDGGVLMNTPLKPAIDAGADELHIIFLDPDVEKVPVSHISNTVQTLYRMQIIAWAAAFNKDIASAREINDGIEALKRIARGAAVTDADAEGFTRAAARIERHLKRPLRYRPLTIHRYNPHDDIGGAIGFLNLERERVRHLIERGYRDAVLHDCQANECVLPDEGAVQENPSEVTP